MPKRTTGRYERSSVGGEEVAAFVPDALPPADPPLALDAALRERLRAAEQALVRLELAGEMVPSLDWFIYAFVRKEAVLSSQIEGTQATLVDLREPSDVQSTFLAEVSRRGLRYISLPISVTTVDRDHVARDKKGSSDAQHDERAAMTRDCRESRPCRNV